MPVRPQLIRLKPKKYRTDIMLCVIADFVKGKEYVDSLKSKIKENYYKRRGKYSPPLEIKDLGVIGNYTDSLTGSEKEQFGFCIISKVGANEEWFEDIVKDAIRELENRRIAYLGGATFYKPTIYVHGSDRL